MRAVFGIVSLLLVLLIVGSLVKKQIATTTAPLPTLQSPTTAASGSAPSLMNQSDITFAPIRQRRPRTVLHL